MQRTKFSVTEAAVTIATATPKFKPVLSFNDGLVGNSDWVGTRFFNQTAVALAAACTKKKRALFRVGRVTCW